MADLEGMITTVGEGRALAPKPQRKSMVPDASIEQWRWPLIAAAVLLGLFVWLFGSMLRSQFIWATTATADWGHTLIVPIIVGYIVYLNRANLLAQPFRTAWSGVPLMILGVGIYVVSTIGPQPLRHFQIETCGVWVTLVGLVLLFFGWRAMRWLWFPLLYLYVFGQSISPRFLNIVTFPMQDLTARGAYWVLMPWLQVDLQGNTLFIFHNGEEKPLNIAEACSGMRMLVAFLALGVLMAYTGFRRNWQRVALVAMAVPTAIVVNVLRVITLGLLSLYDTEFAAGDFHHFVGLVWLVPAFLIYLGLMWIIRHLVIEEDDEPRRTKS